MELLKDSSQNPAVKEALRLFGRAAADAYTVMKQLRGDVRRQEDSFNLLLWIAAFKVHACERLAALMEDNEEKRGEALHKAERLRAGMAKAFSFCLPPSEIAREERYLFAGEGALLAAPALSIAS